MNRQKLSKDTEEPKSIINVLDFTDFYKWSHHRDEKDALSKEKCETEVPDEVLEDGQHVPEAQDKPDC